MPATPQELSQLEALASREGLSHLARMIDVVMSWISSPQLQGNVPPDISANAAVDLIDLLDKLPKVIGYESEVAFVLGYKPLDFGNLPVPDKAVIHDWSEFHNQAITRAGDPMTRDPDELRSEWEKLVDGLAVFVAKRSRVVRQINTVRARREGR